MDRLVRGARRRAQDGPLGARRPPSRSGSRSGLPPAAASARDRTGGAARARGAARAESRSPRWSCAICPRASSARYPRNPWAAPAGPEAKLPIAAERTAPLCGSEWHTRAPWPSATGRARARRRRSRRRSALCRGSAVCVSKRGHSLLLRKELARHGRRNDQAHLHVLVLIVAAGDLDLVSGKNLGLVPDGRQKVHQLVHSTGEGHGHGNLAVIVVQRLLAKLLGAANLHLVGARGILYQVEQRNLRLLVRIRFEQALFAYAQFGRGFLVKFFFAGDGGRHLAQVFEPPLGRRDGILPCHYYGRAAVAEEAVLQHHEYRQNQDDVECAPVHLPLSRVALMIKLSPPVAEGWL